MPETIKIEYKDGTTETFSVPTPKEYREAEEAYINAIPDEVFKIFDVSKSEVLKCVPKGSGK